MLESVGRLAPRKKLCLAQSDSRIAQAVRLTRQSHGRTRSRAPSPRTPEHFNDGQQLRHRLRRPRESRRTNANPHRTWSGLIAWLTWKGVADEKPIHILHNLAGSLVFQAHGIKQARGFLGHGDVSTTSRSFIAKNKRVVVSLLEPTDEVSKARQRG